MTKVTAMKIMMSVPSSFVQILVQVGVVAAKRTFFHTRDQSPALRSQVEQPEALYSMNVASLPALFSELLVLVYLRVAVSKVQVQLSL